MMSEQVWVYNMARELIGVGELKRDAIVPVKISLPFYPDESLYMDDIECLLKHHHHGNGD